MHSCHDVRRQGRLHELATPSHNAEILAQQGLRSSSAQAHQNFRFHCRELRIQPETAGIDLPVAWFLVDAPFSALVRRPVEMLHHIRNIYITSRDANLCQSLIQQLSGRTHEGMTSEIFSISGLLANEDDFSMCAPSPNTVWVARSQRSQALQLAAATRKLARVGFGGISGAAVCCDLYRAALRSLVMAASARRNSKF